MLPTWLSIANYGSIQSVSLIFRFNILHLYLNVFIIIHYTLYIMFKSIL